MKWAMGVALALLPAFGSAQEWEIFGSNEISLEHYGVSGSNPAASPYRFEGTFVTDRLNLGLKLDRAGRTILIEGEFLATDSDYFPEQGAVIGNLSFQIEDGTLAVPYRAGAGDFTAQFSRRTLYRQIRGVSFELQPELGRGSHSILLVNGGGEPDWRDALDRDLAFTGLSWVWAPSETVSFTANLIDARQEANTVGAVPIPTVDRKQRIGSFASTAEIRGIDMEAEVAFLQSELGQEDTDDVSIFAQIGRAEGPLSWRVRFEQNGDEFLPIGGVGVIANRRTAEAEARWVVSRRSTLRARVQHLDSRFEGDLVEQDTEFAGLRWEARPLDRRSSFSIRATADWNDTETEDGSVDRRFTTFGLEARDRWRGLDVNASIRRRETSAAVVQIANRQQLDATVRVGRSFRLAGFRSRIGAGVTYRDQDEFGAYRSWNPVFDASFRRDPHLLGLHLGFMDQTFAAPTVTDLQYQMRRLTYSWTRNPHAVTLEAGEELREREVLGDTDSMRLALRYRYSFERTF